MMKTILASAAALTVMALGAASPASAKSNFSLYIGTPWLSAYSYNYLPYCSYEPRLVTIKSVKRLRRLLLQEGLEGRQGLLLADLACPRRLLTLGRKRAAAFPP